MAFKNIEINIEVRDVDGIVVDHITRTVPSHTVLEVKYFGQVYAVMADMKDLRPYIQFWE